MPINICTFSQLSVEFNGSLLFSELSANLPTGVSALIGRNGQGKSILLKILSGQLPPSQGTVAWHTPFYMVNQLSRLNGPRIADALEVTDIYDCFCRVERGEGQPEDLEKLYDAWHLPAQWQQILDSAHLNISLAHPISQLSGGEQTRLALCMAFLQSKSYLLLDEPSNHLDEKSRLWLQKKLHKHPSGALIVSHDRYLLEHVDNIFELSSNGLKSFGGNYSFYKNIKQMEITATERKAEAVTKQIKQEKQQQQLALQRAAQRRRQGEAQQSSGSQSKLLLDMKKNRSEQNLSKLKQQHNQQNRKLTQELHQYKQQLEQLHSQHITLNYKNTQNRLRIHLNDLVIPWGSTIPISLSIFAGEKWHIRGCNGSGKSTLLKVISARLNPLKGSCQIYGTYLYLDQSFNLLDKTLPAPEALHIFYPNISVTDWRTRLGNIRLRREKAMLPISQLSGGEQLKVTLLAITGGNQVPDILLLDEPENHLDLDSRLLLEEILSNYQGTLILISHDTEFVRQCGIKQEFILTV
ncbi:ABC transporter ATP-binding protein [Photorhabdus luminescens]|nr:ABC transporter ATP-binding protein [Photorhabdus luminescens]